MHTYIMYFQRVCCWFAEAFDLGVLFGVEPCADVIVSAHRSILVGGGAPPVPKNRQRGGGIVIFIGSGGEGAGRRSGWAGGGATAPKNVPKNFVLSSKFSDDL